MIVQVLVAALLVGACSLADAQGKIGIKFVGGRPDTAGVALDASEKVGASDVAQSHWNNATGASGSVNTLTADDGSKVATTVKFTSSEVWTSGSDTSKGPDYKLMDGYIDSTESTDAATIPTVTIKDIPFATYDVYVYYNGDYPGDQRVAKYAIGAKSTLATDSSAFDGTYAEAKDGGTGNYVVFHNITGSSMTLTASPVKANDQYLRAIINAVQIVKHG